MAFGRIQRPGRTVRLWLLAVVTLLVSAGCSSAGLSAGASGRTTLTWWDYFGYSPAANHAVDTMITKYQQSHPNVTINRTSVDFADFRNRIIRASETGSFPDIAVVDSSDLPLLASRNVIADLTPRFERWDKRGQFLEPVLDSVDYQDALYGVPLRSNTTALFYNRDLLAQARIPNPPTNWNELRAAAAALTNPGHAGVCFAAAPNEQLTFNVLPFIWQAEGDVRSIGDKPSVDALSFVDTLVNLDQSAPRAMLQWSHDDVLREFLAGHCAMMINGPWVVPTLGKAGFGWSVAGLPAGAKSTATPLGGEAWVIRRDSSNPDAAWDVLTWLAESKNGGTEIGGGLGGIANRNDTLNDPVWKWGPGVAVFTGEMLTTRPRSVYGPRYPEVSEAIWTMTQQVLTGQRKPQQAATEARAKIQPLLPRE
jgi:multiple sugar transport system substrate-binding protein